MLALLYLYGSNGFLRLEVAEPRDTAILWCKCYLCTDSVLFIGAEDLRYLKARLTGWLTAPESAGWVLSLSEAHYSVYRDHVEAGNALRFFDQEGKFVWRLHIPDSSKIKWQNALAQLP